MKIKIGVMGSAGNIVNQELLKKIEEHARSLAKAIVENNTLLITGETTGVPDLVNKAVRELGGMSIGISPASSKEEHLQSNKKCLTSSDIIIYTGFGVKGRNVVNIRSSDIVIIFSGSIGTLNEFTIAYDEGKVIGVLLGTGGVADHIEEIISICNKPTKSKIVYDHNPEILLKKCLEIYNK